MSAAVGDQPYTRDENLNALRAWKSLDLGGGFGAALPNMALKISILQEMNGTPLLHQSGFPPPTIRD